MECIYDPIMTVKIRAAFHAMRTLIANPDDTKEVFVIVRAFGDRSLRRNYRRFKQTEFGVRVLAEGIDLLDTLNNRSKLDKLPPNSFGREYLEFTQRESLSAYGLVEASIDVNQKIPDDGLRHFACRLRDMHDLWHTLTQYGRDLLGEACLLAFTYAQNKNLGIAFILLMGQRRLRQRYGKEATRTMVQAYRDGKQAKWLPAQDFESLLAQPIDEVRNKLGIVSPGHYYRVRDTTNAMV